MDSGSWHWTLRQWSRPSLRKKCKKAKWLSEEALQIAEKREVKGKGVWERYTHLNAEFQRITRDKKAFLGDQCKEIEESNTMGCEIKWALGSITMNKASGGDGKTVELFQIQKMMLWKCCTQYGNKFGKLSSGHRTGKGQFSFQSQRKVMPKYAQTTTQLHSSQHTSKVMLKILQARLQQYVNPELPDVQTGFRKGRGPSHWAAAEDSAASPLSPLASRRSIPPARLLPPPPSAGRFHRGKGILSYVRYPEPPLFRPLCWCK